MGKAVFGHVGGAGPRMACEMRRLQQRVRDRETGLARLREEKGALNADAGQQDVLVLDGTPLTRTAVAGRATHSCPHCQQR